MGPRRRLITILTNRLKPVPTRWHGPSACAVLAAATLFAQDHVGKPLPEYVTGDECLFCHRVQVADTWQQNPHARTVRPATVEEDKHGFPPDTTDILGASTHF